MRRFAALLFFITAAACGPSQPNLSRAQLLDPEVCGGCHQAQFADWAGSMHAYAADDPVFIAMNQRGQRETKGALGTFCVNCHAPMAVRENATQDGLNLASLSPSLKGVTCYFCHTVDSVQGAHDNPLHLAGGTTMLGEYTDPLATRHPSAYSTLHDRNQGESARLCGACHDIVSPAGGAIERTFSEWENSAFSAGVTGSTCSDCHMNQSATLGPIAQVPHAPNRRAHSHTFAAVDGALDPNFPNVLAQSQEIQSFLDSTLQMALCVIPTGNDAALRVVVDNVAAGHGWPSGSSQDRRAYAEVVAYQNNQIVYQSGVEVAGTPTAQNANDLWVMNDCIFDPAGNRVHMFWQAASYESNALPVLATFNSNDPRFYQTHVEQYFPRNPLQRLGVLPDKVTLRMRLRPVGQDVLDDLVASGDLDASVAARVLTRDVGPWLTWTAQAALTPSFSEGGAQAFCVSTPNFNLAAARTPAVNHTRCTP